MTTPKRTPEEITRNLVETILHGHHDPFGPLPSCVRCLVPWPCRPVRDGASMTETALREAADVALDLERARAVMRDAGELDRIQDEAYDAGADAERDAQRADNETLRKRGRAEGGVVGTTIESTVDLLDVWLDARSHAEEAKP